MCAYLFWSKSKLIDKIKDLELQIEITKKMIEIREREINQLKTKIEQKLNKNQNQTYLWR